MPRGNPMGLLLSINYGRPATTLAFLQNVSTLARFSELHAVIVDNASTSDSAEPLREAIEAMSNAELLESPVNRGYFGAARFAMESYLASGKSIPNWTIVCNNDVTIKDEQFLEKLWNLDPSGIGVIAPRIQSLPLGLEQNPFMRSRPNWARRALIRFVASHYPLAALWNWLSKQKNKARSQFANPKPEHSETADPVLDPIYAPHGAFMIFSRRYFESGGFLDSNLFLYGEEISVAEICVSLGLSVIFDPRLVVLHNEHFSTGRQFTRSSHKNLKRAIRYISKVYWGDKNGGREKMTALSQAQLSRKD
jgi:GT2 family glycosyltransferase